MQVPYFGVMKIPPAPRDFINERSLNDLRPNGQQLNMPIVRHMKTLYSMDNTYVA